MKRVLRTTEAAEYLGLSPSTLEKCRSKGVGPKFLKLAGRAVGYDLHDLDEWLDQQRDNTHDNTPGGSREPLAG